MRLLPALALGALVTGCAMNPHPAKRPLTEEAQQKIGAADLVVAENNHGVGATWFRQDSSAAGQQYGLIGAITTSIIDAIANSGPSSRAKKAANYVGETISTDHLNDSFVEAAKKVKAGSDGQSIQVRFDNIQKEQLIGDKNKEGTLVADLDYRLSESGSSIKVTALVRYNDSNLTYVTPYTFENGKIPKSQIGGPIYYNSFTYESDRLPVPTMTPELEKTLVSQIENRFKNEEGKLPEPKTSEYKKMKKELEDARDGKLSKSEALTFMVENWVGNNGELTLSEITKAHDFVIRHLILDLNRTDVPSLEGEDQILETLEDGRIVRMVGKGYTAGSIVSSPGNVEDFVTYGNTVTFSEKNADRVKELNAKAKKAAKAQKSK